MLSSLERWQESSVYWVQKQNLVGNLLLHLLHKLSGYVDCVVLETHKNPEVPSNSSRRKVWQHLKLFFLTNQSEGIFQVNFSSQRADPWCHNYLLARIMVIAVDITRYCFTPRWEPENYSKRLAVYFSSLGSIFQFQVMLQFLGTKVDFPAFEVFLKIKESLL